MTTPGADEPPAPTLDAFEVAFAKPEHGWLDFTVMPLTGDGYVSATDLADPFPGMIAWLEQIAGGAETARWLIDEERGSCAQFVFLGARRLFTGGTPARLILLTASDTGRICDLTSCSVTPLGVVRRFYRSFRSYAESDLYDPVHWENWGTINDPDSCPPRNGSPRILRSPLLEAALAGQPAEDSP